MLYHGFDSGTPSNTRGKTVNDWVALPDTSSNYRLEHVGQVKLPPYRYDATNVSKLGVTSILDKYAFSAWVELLGGTPASDTITIDAIILIPSRFLLSFEDDFKGKNIVAVMSENGTRKNLNEIYVSVSGDSTIAIPVGGGIAVCAIQDTNSAMADEVELTFTIFDRYESYAGNG